MSGEPDVPVQVVDQPAAPVAIEPAIDYPPVQFQHVADEIALEDAVRELKYATHIFLDCEGYQLGAVGGSMSLINVSCGPDGVVYIVDATAFDRDTLEPLFELLRNPEIKKVMFDGRMDASEFMHGYGVEIEGVLDMQIADISSRGMRGEGSREQLARLRPFIHHQDMQGHGRDYVLLHRLNGLVRCMAEHKLPFIRRNEAYHERWQERPLPNAMLLAAARDVCYIRALWEHFIRNGWIAQGELEAQSVRYIALVRDMRPFQWDNYRCNGLLPQGILRQDDGNETQAPWTCELCKRELARCWFLYIAHYRADRRFCATCRALRIRQLRAEERQNGDRSNIWQFLSRDEGRAVLPSGPRPGEDRLGEHRIELRRRRREMKQRVTSHRREAERHREPERRREPDRRREREQRFRQPMQHSGGEREDERYRPRDRDAIQYRAKYRDYRGESGRFERERRPYGGRDHDYHSRSPSPRRRWQVR